MPEITTPLGAHGASTEFAHLLGGRYLLLTRLQFRIAPLSSMEPVRDRAYLRRQETQPC